jgi:hypothetical protein
MYSAGISTENRNSDIITILLLQLVLLVWGFEKGAIITVDHF